MGLNRIGKGAAGATQIGLAPVQAAASGVDLVGSVASTVTHTAKNILKTLSMPFVPNQKPDRKNYMKDIWGTPGFKGRQKEQRKKYCSFIKNPSEALWLSKIAGATAHYPTAITAQAIITTLDAGYSAVKTPLSILKNVGKTLAYPVLPDTHKPKFKKDLQNIWGKSAGFKGRTQKAWHDVFDILPKLTHKPKPKPIPIP